MGRAQFKANNLAIPIVTERRKLSRRLLWVPTTFSTVSEITA